VAPGEVDVNASNDYQFVTRWRVRGRAEDVADLLEDFVELPRWWPAVYLDARELERGENGVGQLVALHTKGWLPYDLHWCARVVENRHPRGFTIDATGDFLGRGAWTFEQDGDHVDIAFDWRLRAEKPLLRRLSFLLKPLFAANHRWAMARGEESLALELARRASSDEERASIPPPPGPTRAEPYIVLGAGVVVMLLLGKRLLRSLRQR
jgi:hypothetical protein